MRLFVFTLSIIGATIGAWYIYKYTGSQGIALLYCSIETLLIYVVMNMEKPQ